MKTVIEMAREAGCYEKYEVYYFIAEQLEAFAALVREDEREKIMDEWWSCVQSDLEHGIKSVNERAAIEWKKNYPAISTFAESVEKL